VNRKTERDTVGPDTAPNVGAPNVRAVEPSGVARESPPAAAALGSGQQAAVLAVVKDLFFVARIRETARLAGVALAIARGADELEAGVPGPRLILLDLTGGFDYTRIFAAAERAGIPVVAFTTHALARQTQPWHARCARVVTKETLTTELPALLRQGAS